MNDLIKAFGPASNDMQLICFPFAGGYSTSFRPLYEHLKADCDMLAIEPPGHGTNQMDLVDDFETLVGMYQTALEPKLTRPFVLFGYSMGGMVAYRMAQKLEKAGIYPKAVIISAIQPPDIKRKKVSHYDDDAFLDHIIQLGGMPDELVRNREVMDYFLPSFRADYRALESFLHTDHTLVSSPVYILNGDKDEKCMQDAHGWKKWVREAEFHSFEGGHMFLLSQTEQISALIRSIIAAAGQPQK
ncbi:MULTISPECIES: thioesterase II family protein [Bacillus]|uniref:thioesterase II family protein n=1 Tax=Bacillus TaxID=1386 RepID=UPI00049751A1|nr:alpha/beta fold hydrolase [Bacillus sonorensis]MBG9913394.1 thioesterase [Bacillus sonorensis]MDR4956809.1 alpha/beta fold hydrolase [Bacillus sonorensis]MEC1538071.1 alpha/beta fold hydrolase [Bacillus sonorensis]MEC1591660.1 alpha/beta fold hydrolase [Bacillus sonorensis]GIN69091.1 surfactin synthase thioesterase subunit [Bacillus sonorensis]